MLNNLARFVENPETVPHFEVPTSGGTNVNDTTTLSATPIDVFREAFGLMGVRAEINAWTLRPVTEPDRLRRIQCAFQRAVGYQTPNCTDCCALEQPFLDTPAISAGPLFDQNGKRTLDPVTGQPFRNVTALSQVAEYYADGQPTGKMIQVYRPMASGQGDPINPALTMRRPVTDDGIEIDNVDPVFYMEYTQGVLTEATREPFDCQSQCAVQPCWFKFGRNRATAKSQSRGLFGEHMGVYVWVPECHRAEFGKLVFSVLEYATTDPPAEETKQVTLYLNHQGGPADRNSASQVITRTIPATARNIALEQGKIAVDNDETRAFADLLQLIFDIEQSISESVGEPDLKPLVDRFKKNNVRAIDRNPILEGLVSECEECLGNDANSHRFDGQILRSLSSRAAEGRFQSIPRTRSQTMNSEASRENLRIQKASPRRRDRSIDSLRDFSLRQELLLPEGQ